jgi:TP901 family phage tail tape measure protein
MPDFAMSTMFKGTDHLSKHFKRMAKNAKFFGRTTENAFERASKSGRRLHGVTSSILKAGAVSRGLGLLSSGISTVTSEFIQFDDSIMGAAARFKDIGPGADNFNQKMDVISKAARRAGSTTEFTSAQAAKGLDFLARAGFNSKEAIQALVPMINLATASGEDFQSVTDKSSDLLGAFGLAGKNATEKIKNLNRLNDVLVKSANSANVTIESQFETMKTAGPIFAIFGDNLEEVAAITAAMGNAGIKGTEGATALKNAILRLAAPTKKAQAGINKLGLSLDDISTVTAGGKRNMKKMIDILKIMGPKLSKLGTKDQADVLDAIFGKRAIAAMGGLVKVIKNVEKFETTLKNAGGTSKKTADLMRKSLGNRIKTLQSAATELGFKFLDAFKGDGVDAITALTKSIQKFDVKPVTNALKIGLEILKTLWTVISPFLPAIIAITAAVKLWAIAQGILNVAMTANPIGLVIAGVALLVAGFMHLVRLTGGVKNAFIVIGKTIMQAMMWPLNMVINGIVKLLQLMSAIPGVGGKFASAAQTVSNFQEKMNSPFKITEFKASNRVDGNINVNFENAPQGTTASAKSKPGTQFKLAGLGAQ